VEEEWKGKTQKFANKNSKEEKMSTQNESQKKAKFGNLGAAMSLGLVLGGLVGILIDNMIIFAGGGMIVGLSIGLALEKKRLTS
jgi:F0F1-type ATP synthase assembly protein I